MTSYHCACVLWQSCPRKLLSSWCSLQLNSVDFYLVVFSHFVLSNCTHFVPNLSFPPSLNPNPTRGKGGGGGGVNSFPCGFWPTTSTDNIWSAWKFPTFNLYYRCIIWGIKIRRYSKRRLAKKRRKIMNFVSDCPKSSPKPLFEPKIRMSIQFWNPLWK